MFIDLLSLLGLLVEVIFALSQMDISSDSLSFDSDDTLTLGLGCPELGVVRPNDLE